MFSGAVGARRRLAPVDIATGREVLRTELVFDGLGQEPNGLAELGMPAGRWAV